jgi:hypothetical protein
MEFFVRASGSVARDYATKRENVHGTEFRELLYAWPRAIYRPLCPDLFGEPLGGHQCSGELPLAEASRETAPGAPVQMPWGAGDKGECGTIVAV